MLKFMTPEDEAFYQWTLAETAYEAFLADKPERIVLRQMTDDEFGAWLAEYKSLHDTLYERQGDYYKAVRLSGRESGDYEAWVAEAWEN